MFHERYLGGKNLLSTQISGDRVRNTRKASCMVQVWYIQKNLSNNASVLPVDGIEFAFEWL